MKEHLATAGLGEEAEELETQVGCGGEGSDWERAGQQSHTNCFPFKPLPGMDKSSIHPTFHPVAKHMS